MNGRSRGGGGVAPGSAEYPRGSRGVVPAPRNIHVAAAASPRLRGISTWQPRRRRDRVSGGRGVVPAPRNIHVAAAASPRPISATLHVVVATPVSFPPGHRTFGVLVVDNVVVEENQRRGRRAGQPLRDENHGSRAGGRAPRPRRAALSVERRDGRALGDDPETARHRRVGAVATIAHDLEDLRLGPAA